MELARRIVGLLLVQWVLVDLVCVSDCVDLYHGDVLTSLAPSPLSYTPLAALSPSHFLFTVPWQQARFPSSAPALQQTSVCRICKSSVSQLVKELQLCDAAASVTRIRTSNNEWMDGTKVQIYGYIYHHGFHINHLLKCPNSKAPPISFSC